MIGPRSLVSALLAAALVAGCSSDRVPGKTPETIGASPRPQSWQKTIRDADRKRLAGLWTAWTRALAQADGAGRMPQVSALGALADADAARAAPAPVPGQYRCRTVKLGIRDDGTRLPAGAVAAPVLMTSSYVPCTITAQAGLLWFEQIGGAQRIAGKLYPDGDRQVFLGAMALAGEAGVRSYGTDRDRDQVGVLRAFADKRWRLELPWPMWQSNLAIIEIVPA